jgi:protein phosphatase
MKIRGKWMFRKLSKKTFKTAPKTLTEVSVASLGNAESFAASIIFQNKIMNRLYILISSKTKNIILRLASEISEKMLLEVTDNKEDNYVNDFLKHIIAKYSISFCLMILINDKIFAISKGENYIYAYNINSQELHKIHDDLLVLKDFSGYIYLVSSQREQEIVNYLVQFSKENLLPSELSVRCVNLLKSMGITDFSLSLLGINLPIVNLFNLRKLRLYSAHSDIGRERKINEDSILASNIKYSCFGELLSSFILLVADGAGGHLYGKEASQEALRLTFSEILRSNIINSFKSDVSFLNLKKAIENVNYRIMDLRESKKADLFTTLTTIVIIGNNAFIAHCGDSRMYVLKGNELSLITEDHKYVMELVKAGVITLEESKLSSQRNILTSALGMKAPRIDFKHLYLDGDEVFLICSDGLTDLVDDTEIKAYIKYYKYPSLISRALIDLANKRGGLDNISIAILVPGSRVFE